MHCRLTSADLGSFFFQPFDLHLQAADLLVEFLLVCGLVGTPLPPVGKQLRHLGHKLLLPRRHLTRVDAELARQLSRRPVTLSRRQGHLCLEYRPKYSSLPGHRPAPDRVPPTHGAPPYQGARKPGSTSHFLEKYGAKYEAACNCLSKDRDVLLAIYDFPAEHWGHVRTTNPIESTLSTIRFSTIRLRHPRTKGSGSRRASLAMMFELAQSASRR
jgi:hypothetical protein